MSSKSQLSRRSPRPNCWSPTCNRCTSTSSRSSGTICRRSDLAGCLFCTDATIRADEAQDLAILPRQELRSTMTIEIRHTEPDDYVAVHAIMTSPKVVEGTLQLPFQSIEQMRKRTAEPSEGAYPLVACINGEVVGTIGLHTVARPRRKHVAELGMAVRDDQQGKGVGS